MTPLTKAASKGDTQAMQTAIKSGANVNEASTGRGSANPIIWAVWSDLSDQKILEMIKLLVENGANINARDESGYTLLYWAVNYRKPEVIKYLIMKGAEGGPQVKTDKDIYNQGEMIKVNFFNSPGSKEDWICIVPEGSLDTEEGDYKYLRYLQNGGLGQGVLFFDPPSPGKYEARAYYNYDYRNSVVSARYGFSVVSVISPEEEEARAQRMERKTDPQNPLEVNLPSGKGLVYIFREASFSTTISPFGGISQEAQIKANGKPVVSIGNFSYFPFSVPAGDVKFTIGSINTMLQAASERESEANIKVKPGYVYYLRVCIIPRPPSWTFSLEHLPNQGGADIIKGYKLIQIKR